MPTESWQKNSVRFKHLGLQVDGATITLNVSGQMKKESRGSHQANEWSGSEMNWDPCAPHSLARMSHMIPPREQEVKASYVLEEGRRTCGHS